MSRLLLLQFCDILNCNYWTALTCPTAAALYNNVHRNIRDSTISFTDTDRTFGSHCSHCLAPCGLASLATARSVLPAADAVVAAVAAAVGAAVAPVAEQAAGSVTVSRLATACTHRLEGVDMDGQTHLAVHLGGHLSVGRAVSKLCPLRDEGENSFTIHEEKLSPDP